MRSCTYGFIAVHSAGANNSYWQFSFFHFTYLNIAGMCTQQPIWVLGNVKCILHISCRMVFGKIKCSKIMPVIFNLRAFCNSKTKTLKNRDDLIFYNIYWMTASDWKRIAWKSEIDFVICYR